jgi:subtilase family serine protease
VAVDRDSNRAQSQDNQIIRRDGVQARSLISGEVDPYQVRPLLNHHPLWANPANDIGPVAPDKTMEALTLVLTRPAEQERAFEQFLAEQQDSASPNYHHWLTPAEVGERFGPSDSDIAAITDWLQAEGLHVNWVAPSKTFIGFSGAVADVSRVFQTEVHTYFVRGKERISVSSDPTIPEAVGPVIMAIHGLYTIDEQPQHIATAKQSARPQITTSNGSHFIGPGDFAKIYDLPASVTGAGMTIGIVGRSRTDFADFDNFKSLVGANFTDPTEIVPTAYGGVDPGPAYTSPPSGSASIGDQSEATLDVVRAGSVASGAKLLLVVATSSSGGIGADVQYLVNTTPVPAQVMTISFGACESAAGSSGVSFWDALFKQAAAEGISTFVSSGDSGASGCDLAFHAPPTSPQANSPNYICSSTYVTCVGGTEFNDTSNPSTYWTLGTGGPATSALGYIPEGGWNESWNGSVSTVASSGGGVSAYIATPSWQSGVIGVPTSNAGRYTPDVSFSSALHDGYFACFAAGGAGCVVSGGSFYFTVFGGTSAAAPGMAGIAALLDQTLGGTQGNLNPGIYQMAVSAPTAFHDVTLASSGVTSCDLNTPSLCNNSIPGPAGLSGGQPGYAIGKGYDEVTGLGSLDAQAFVYAYGTSHKIMTPTVALYTVQTVATNQPLTVGVSVNGSSYSPYPTGNVTATIGSYTSAATPLSTGNANINVPAGTLPVGSYTLNVAYTPDSASTSIYTSASASQSLSVIVPPKVTPSLTLTQSQLIISNSQTMTVGVVVNTAQYYPTPTGSVVLTSGSYTSASAALAAGSATITIPAGSLAVGNDTLTVTYTPDAASSSSYLVSSNDIFVQNEGATITPAVWVAPNPSPATTSQAIMVSVTVNGFQGNPIPTGKVALTSGTYSSAAIMLSGGNASFNLAPGALPTGLNTITATYTPDPQSSALYSSANGTNQVGISLAQKITPVMTFTQLTSNPTTAQPLSLAITLGGGAGYPTPGGAVQVGTDLYLPVTGALSGGSATVTLPPTAFIGGANIISANYVADANSLYIYNQTSSTLMVNVAKVTPTVSVTAAPSSASTTDSINVTVTVSGGAGAPNATGAVTLTSGPYLSGPSFLSSGTATINIPPGWLIPGADTLTVAYAGDNSYSSTSGTSSVVVTAPAGAGFAISGTSVNVGQSSLGSRSTVTVTPTPGFVGAVSLAAVLTSQPAGAQHLPNLSFGSTSPVSVTGFNPATATLSISTTPASTSAVHPSVRPGARWYPAGGAVLACLLFFVAPARRRGLSLLGMLFLLVVLAGGVASCGGGGGSPGGGGVTPGTTPGQYTITITGTSGTTTANATITLTVQ